MIRLYSEADPTKVIDLTDAKSLVSGHNKRNFKPDVRKVYIRNDDPTKWMSNVEINGTSENFDVVSGTNGFGLKLYKGELEPGERVWNATPFNYPVSFLNIGTDAVADTSFYPIWLRIEVSPYAEAAAYKMLFKASYVEHPV